MTSHARLIPTSPGRQPPTTPRSVYITSLIAPAAVLVTVDITVKRKEDRTRLGPGCFPGGGGSHRTQGTPSPTPGTGPIRHFHSDGGRAQQLWSAMLPHRSRGRPQPPRWKTEGHWHIMKCLLSTSITAFPSTCRWAPRALPEASRTSVGAPQPPRQLLRGTKVVPVPPVPQFPSEALLPAQAAVGRAGPRLQGRGTGVSMHWGLSTVPVGRRVWAARLRAPAQRAGGAAAPRCAWTVRAGVPQLQGSPTNTQSALSVVWTPRGPQQGPRLRKQEPTTFRTNGLQEAGSDLASDSLG